MHGVATIKTRTRITLDLDPSERKRLQSHADANERSLSQELRLAVREYLDKLNRRAR
jgi:hypothetical protein